MRTFKDNQGRDWSVQFTVGTIKRVRELLGVNLVSIADGDPAGDVINTRLQTDFEFIVDVLYCVCKPQADELGVNDIAFGESLGGDSLGDAQRALIEELVLFFPNPSSRRVIEKRIQRLD